MPDDLPISRRLTIPGHALRVVHARSGGPGGQNVNTRATKIQLFLDLDTAGLHPAVRRRLVEAHPSKVTSAGEFLLAATTHRSQEANLLEARERLTQLLQAALIPPKPRRKTRPTRASKERRLKAKSRRGDLKKSRGKNFDR